MHSKKYLLPFCALLLVIPACCACTSPQEVPSAAGVESAPVAVVLSAPPEEAEPTVTPGRQNEKQLAALIEAAHSPDEDVQKAAIKSLGEMGGQQAAGALAELLTIPDRNMRIRVILALAATGRVGYPYLLHALETEPFPRGRMFAANAVARLAEPGDAPAIMKRFDNQDAATKMHLVIAIVKVGDDEAIAALNQLMESPDRLIRFYVVNTLADAPPNQRALPLLINALQDDAEEVRMWTMFALERLNDPSSFPAVAAAFNDEDAYVRKEVAYTLGQLGNKEAVPYLIEGLKDPMAVVRGEAAASLGLLGDPQVIQALEPLLRESNVGVQIKAAAALARLGDYSGMDILIATVDSPVRPYSKEAVLALEEISNKDFGRDSNAWRSWWKQTKETLGNTGKQERD